LAAESFAALFLAHVIADYLLQSAWLVRNKRRPLALAIHIGLVLATMIAVTGMLSPWFAVLAALHLAIDLTKTFVLPDGIGSYIADQMLHLASIVAIALWVPGLWAQSPWADVAALPQAYLIAGGVLFAARGGQFALDHLLRAEGRGTATGVWIGVMERAFLAGGVLAGALWLSLAVIGLKALYAARLWPEASALTRRRLAIGSAASFAWALATAVPLSLWVGDTF
jgi:hypothetical protein